LKENVAEHVVDRFVTGLNGRGKKILKIGSSGDPLIHDAQATLLLCVEARKGTSKSKRKGIFHRTERGEIWTEGEENPRPTTIRILTNQRGPPRGGTEEAVIV